MESYLLVERWRISKQDHKSRQRKLDLSLMCCWLFVCLGGTDTEARRGQGLTHVATHIANTCCKLYTVLKS
jgi:hypothetical protein